MESLPSSESPHLEASKQMIRKATSSDLGEISALARNLQEIHSVRVPSLFKPSDGDSEFLEWFENVIRDEKSFVIVAEEAGKIAGYLYACEVIKEESWVTHAQRNFYLHHIAVNLKKEIKGSGLR